MTGLVLGTLLSVADASTHWQGFRWASYALTLCMQALAVATWVRARRQPVAVMFTCPHRCGFLGDFPSLNAHEASCWRRPA